MRGDTVYYLPLNDNKQTNWPQLDTSSTDFVTELLSDFVDWAEKRRIACFQR